jgi:PleD family two-component response regulator
MVASPKPSSSARLDDLCRVLIIGEDEHIARRVSRLVRSLRCDVGVATSAKHALTIAIATEPDVIVISATWTPPEDPFELALSMRAKMRGPLRLVAMGDGAEPGLGGGPFDRWLQLPPTTAGVRRALGLA